MHRHRARVDPRHQGAERGGGDAGVSTPRCSATRIRCTLLYGMDRHVIQASRLHHHHHNHHLYHHHHLLMTQRAVFLLEVECSGKGREVLGVQKEKDGG